MSYLNKTAEKAIPCCTFVNLGMQAIGFLFEKEYILFFFFLVFVLYIKKIISS